MQLTLKTSFYLVSGEVCQVTLLGKEEHLAATEFQEKMES
nr:MAG TPA: hypothetical protein [Caudoviricetes sp.]